MRRFDKARKRAGLTNKQAARWIGVSVWAIHKWNALSPPAPRYAWRMLAAYRLIRMIRNQRNRK